MKLLWEMEMFDECGKDLEEEEMEVDQPEAQGAWLNIIGNLPNEIMPTTQELTEENMTMDQ
jgi:hypothetical protein